MSRSLKLRSKSFKLSVISDYYSSGMSKVSCAKKWNIPTSTLYDWLSSCTNEKEAVSLQSESKDSVMDTASSDYSRLLQENENLRRSLELERLRVKAYERLLEIIKEEDGIDLLKKVVPSNRQPE